MSYLMIIKTSVQWILKSENIDLAVKVYYKEQATIVEKLQSCVYGINDACIVVNHDGETELNSAFILSSPGFQNKQISH